MQLGEGPRNEGSAVVDVGDRLDNNIVVGAAIATLAGVAVLVLGGRHQHHHLCQKLQSQPSLIVTATNKLMMMTTSGIINEGGIVCWIISVPNLQTVLPWQL